MIRTWLLGLACLPALAFAATTDTPQADGDLSVRLERAQNYPQGRKVYREGVKKRNEAVKAHRREGRKHYREGQKDARQSVREARREGQARYREALKRHRYAMRQEHKDGREAYLNALKRNP